jgi:hypothetical protein
LSQQPVLALHFHSIICFVEFVCFFVQLLLATLVLSFFSYYLLTLATHHHHLPSPYPVVPNCVRGATAPCVTLPFMSRVLLETKENECQKKEEAMNKRKKEQIG